MKTILYLTTLFLLLHLGEESPVHWLSPMEHDFGDITLKEPVHHSFQFKNTSGAPMVIEIIRSSCGCTAADWEDTVIEPDSIGTIDASYDAHIKGYFHKQLKVYFNGQRKAEKLWLKGYVIE